MRYQGHYTDGKSAQRRPAGVQLGSGALRIYGEAGEVLETWPYDGLELLEEVYGRGPVRLHHLSQGNAVLTLDSVEILAELESLSGRRYISHRFFRPGPRTALFAALALAVVVAALFFGLPRLVAPLAVLVPPSWEQALGAKVVEQLNAGADFCDAPAGAATLQRLTARLTGTLQLPYPIVVRVSSREGLNAFAAPGGQIVILRELLESVESPEELAGVLAHEIAHAAERHPLQGLLRAAGLQVLFGALTGDVTALDTAAGQFGQMLVLLSFNRADELEADRIGTGLLNAARIRGDGLLTFLRRIGGKSQAGAGLPNLLSTHPLYEERIRQIKALALTEGAAMSARDWRALRDICP
ncbi:MAG: M48 family metallopeptidase [SAR324 cluster bacterium]|nr:M48 family metallopeptidase [SAR324 cluster bacterium]